VTIGLQDFVGTGISSAEYIVATKSITPRVKVTAGLGWGRLGSYGSIGDPFGARPATVVGGGGKPNVNQWFRGPAAPFAGIEWQVSDRVGLKFEYSSDSYDLEDRQRGVIDRRSPFNFGVEYKVSEIVRLGAYYLYGSEVGVTAQITLDPKRRMTGGILGPTPIPVNARPARTSNPGAWSQDWALMPQAAQGLGSALQKLLDTDGLEIEALALNGTTAQLRLRNPQLDSGAQAIGRAARALAATMPASVETFEIVPVVNGIAASKVVILRSDLEELQYVNANDAILRQRVTISDAGPLPDGAFRPDGLYPRLSWSLSPYIRPSLFDPDDPYRADLGVRLSARYDIAPGLVLSGALSKRLVGNLDNSSRVSNSLAPHKVRTDAVLYDRNADPAIDNLTLAWYSRPGPSLYGRVTVGYLERMYGGVSAELMWKRVSSPLAVGVEVNYAKQRDFDGLLGFQDYGVVTGHVSAYYDFGGGFVGQVDVGRYLAGDIGATVALDREFANGWKVGAFATLTDMPFDTFGEGSFDKGIRVQVPVNWLLGIPTRTEVSTILRPVQRDGGARLDVGGRLYPEIRKYHSGTLDSQWGRVWR